MGVDQYFTENYPYGERSDGQGPRGRPDVVRNRTAYTHSDPRDTAASIATESLRTSAMTRLRSAAVEAALSGIIPCTDEPTTTGETISQRISKAKPGTSAPMARFAP